MSRRATGFPLAPARAEVRKGMTFPDVVETSHHEQRYGETVLLF